MISALRDLVPASTIFFVDGAHCPGQARKLACELGFEPGALGLETVAGGTKSVGDTRALLRRQSAQVGVRSAICRIPLLQMQFAFRFRWLS